MTQAKWLDLLKEEKFKRFQAEEKLSNIYQFFDEIVENTSTVKDLKDRIEELEQRLHL